MFDKTYLLHEQRRQDLMRTAAHERLANSVQHRRRPAIGLILAWTGRRLVDTGRRLQQIADPQDGESTVAVQSRTT